MLRSRPKELIQFLLDFGRKSRGADPLRDRGRLGTSRRSGGQQPFQRLKFHRESFLKNQAVRTDQACRRILCKDRMVS